jgi:hypothetical protein
LYNISFTEKRKDLKERHKKGNKEVKEREGGREGGRELARTWEKEETNLQRGTERYQTGMNIRKKRENIHRPSLLLSICFELSLYLIPKCFMLPEGSALYWAHLVVSD